MLNRIVQLARHRRFQPFWRRIHRISLIGMNYWASEFACTGEREALSFVAREIGPKQPVILFDVGANIGDFSLALREIFGPGCVVHAFEPSAATFVMLEANLGGSGVITHRLGFSDRRGTATLHASEPGCSIATLVAVDRPVRAFDPAFDEEVTLDTIDLFCADQGIERIDFLKMDIEGHELAALNGANRMIGEGRISVLQFEFGQNNIGSESFLADFVRLLAGYDFYRVVPGGPVPWTYQDGADEIFATMNYLAVRQR